MQELENVRLGLGFSQQDMAKLLGVRRETYNTWKQGKHYPEPGGLVKIYSLFKTIEEDRPDLEIWNKDENWTTERWIELVKADVEKIADEKIATISEESKEKILKDD